MATTVTPVSQFVATASLAVRPQDGDDAFMDGGAAPLMPVLQNLFDRTEAARDALINHLSWAEELSITGLSTNTNADFSLVVGAINEVLLYNGSTYVPKAYAGGTIGLSKVESTPANLDNSTWYYLYAFNNAGSLDFQISKTAPNASLTAKSSSAQYRYLGCFVTNSSGAPVLFRMKRHRYIYRRSGITAPGILNVLATATEVGWTDLSVAALVPPHSCIVIIDANLNATGGSAYLDLRTKGDTGDVSLHLLSTTNDVHGSVEMETNSSRVIQYTLALGTGSDSYGQVWVMGFTE